jgi:hypothetical protein
MSKTIILIILGEETDHAAAHHLLGPNILLSTLFSNTLNLCSSLNVRDQISHPYKTTGKIIVLEGLWKTAKNLSIAGLRAKIIFYLK